MVIVALTIVITTAFKLKLSDPSLPGDLTDPPDSSTSMLNLSARDELENSTEHNFAA